eukprot:987430_1
MMQRFAFVVFIGLVILGVESQPPQDTPDCIKVSPPFTDETEALEAPQALLQCLYDYFKAGDAYHGMKGFKEMFGDTGYMFNESMIWDVDGETMNGYHQFRAKTVVAQNVMDWMTAPVIIQPLVKWSTYNVSFNYSLNVSLGFGVFKGRPKTINVTSTIAWFEDDSGIIRYRRIKSTSSLLGAVVSTTLKTTKAISGILGYLDDDVDDNYDNKYIQNPIRLIFICVFSILNLFLAICICGCGRLSYDGFVKRKYVLEDII